MNILSFNNGLEIFFSYETPVAGFIPGKGYVRTDLKISVTTSRHIGYYCKDVDCLVISHEELIQLIEPL